MSTFIDQIELSKLPYLTPGDSSQIVLGAKDDGLYQVVNGDELKLLSSSDTAELDIKIHANTLAIEANTIDIDANKITIDAHEITITADSLRIDAALVEIDSTKSSLDNTTGILTTLSTSYTQTAEAITLLATKDEVNTLTGTVEQHSGMFTVQAELIAAKVSTNDFDSLGQLVTQQSSELTMTAQQIALKVSATDFDALGAIVSEHDTAIIQNADEILLKANTSDLDTVSGIVTEHSSSLSVQADEIATKVSTTTFNDLSDIVTVQQTTITQTADAIALKADTTTVDSIAGTVAEHTAALSVQADEIALRVSTDTYVADQVTIQQQLTDAAALAESIKADLQTQLDGNIMSWFYAYTPSLLNEPASLWTTDIVRNDHLGDLFYDTVTNLAYRYVKVGTVYDWSLLADTDLALALFKASQAQDTADHKRRIFGITPYTPYDLGDLWVGGSTADIKYCVVSRQTGAFADTDFALASKYTDDTAAIAVSSRLDAYVIVTDSAITSKVSAETFNSLNDRVDLTESTIIQHATDITLRVTTDVFNQAILDANAYVDATKIDLTTQIDKKVESWFYSTVPTLNNLPASDWNDNTTRNLHLGDLYYDTTTGFAYRFMVTTGTYSWGNIKDQDVTRALANASTAQDTADHKRRVFGGLPITPYDIGDLWVINNNDLWQVANGLMVEELTGDAQHQGKAGDIMICIVKRTTGNYVAGDFMRASKYTDDTAANAAQVTADNAQLDATNANSLLTDIAADNKLTPSEKSLALKEWTVIQAEKNSITAQGTIFNVDTVIATAYETAYTALANYINPILTDMTTTATITGSTFRNKFADYYSAKVNLLKEITHETKAQLVTTADGIGLLVVKDDIMATINASIVGGESAILIHGDRIDIEGALTVSGIMTAGLINADKINVGDITAVKLAATSGTIAGFTIDGDGLTNTTGTNAHFEISRDGMTIEMCHLTADEIRINTNIYTATIYNTLTRADKVNIALFLDAQGGSLGNIALKINTGDVILPLPRWADSGGHGTKMYVCWDTVQHKLYYD